MFTQENWDVRYVRGGNGKHCNWRCINEQNSPFKAEVVNDQHILIVQKQPKN